MNDLIMIIAKTCHEANKAFCEANGDYSQVRWEDAAQWQFDATVAGVTDRINNPGGSHGKSHDTWVNSLISAGWKYGPVKDAEAKTHPLLVPFEDLPDVEKKKDYLFCAIVDALK